MELVVGAQENANWYCWKMRARTGALGGPTNRAVAPGEVCRYSGPESMQTFINTHQRAIPHYDLPKYLLFVLLFGFDHWR